MLILKHEVIIDCDNAAVSVLQKRCTHRLKHACSTHWSSIYFLHCNKTEAVHTATAAPPITKATSFHLPLSWMAAVENVYIANELDTTDGSRSPAVGIICAHNALDTVAQRHWTN